MSRYFGIPLRNGLPLGLGTVATLRNGGASGPANSATAWYFASLGLTGTPWANVRRTGTATFVNSSGLIESLPDLGGGQFMPRLTWNASTLAPLGLLVEGQATNLFGRTDDLSASPWALQAATVQGTRVTGPDGALSAQRFTPTTADAAITQDRAPASVVAFTDSVWLRSATGSSFDIALRLIRNSPFTSVASQTITVTPTWQRFTFTATPLDTTTHRWRIGAGSVWGLGEVLDVWGPQLETGSVATSYIPNPATTSALRVADWTGPGVALTGAALAAAFPGGVTGPFTGVIKYRKGYSVATDETLLALSAGSTAGGTNLFAVQTNGTQAKLTTSAGDGTATGTLVHDGSTVNRIAYSVDPTHVGSELVVNGGGTTLSGWTVSGDWVAASGQFVKTGANTATISQSILTLGKAYIVEFDLVAVSGGGVLVYTGSGGAVTHSTPGTKRYIATCAGDTNLYVQCLGSSMATIDNISVREAGRMSISVNGGAAVETTGIAYTGAGVAALIPGSQTYGGTEPMGAAVIDAWDNTRSTYITGAALQALTA